jgi:CHASE1-domain containing sensor protein
VYVDPCCFISSIRKAAIEDVLMTGLPATTSDVTALGSNRSVFITYFPVFDDTNDNSSTMLLKGIISQALQPDLVVIDALSGFKNNTIQVTWIDTTIESSSSLVYAWNGNATNIGDFSFEFDVHFAQRSWHFKLVNVVVVTGTEIEFSAITVVLFLGTFAIIGFTVAFLRNRLVMYACVSISNLNLCSTKQQKNINSKTKEINEIIKYGCT